MKEKENRTVPFSIFLVGSCINLAARLEKLPGVSLSFSARGFDPESRWKPDDRKNWLLVKVAIRGIGDNELVYIRKADYDRLNAKDKKIYREP